MISMIHALDMQRPPAHAYFRGAVFIDEMFRRSESGPRQAMLNYLTDSKVFMQGVSNAVVHLASDVLDYLKSHDPTYIEIEPPAAAESSTGSTLTQLSPFTSFRAEAPSKPLVQHEFLPHEQIVAVQAAGQWLWATVWLVDENNTRGESRSGARCEHHSALQECVLENCATRLAFVQLRTSLWHFMQLLLRLL